jgi:hypothetical protein
MSATLKNKDRQPLVVMLDHPAFATKAHGWRRTTAKFARHTDEGGRITTEVRRAYPGTLTLQPGESIEGLHEAIQHCSQIPALRAKRLVEITIQEDSRVAIAKDDDEEHGDDQ